MTKFNPVKICFAGSGDLAVPILSALIKDQRFVIKSIITQPDKPAGRKKILTPCPVGQFCAAENLEVIKPISVNTPEILSLLRNEDLDFVVVASFGQLLKRDFLNLPKKGCVNIHASILPRWRGASPITAVILNGEQETGICYMAMDEGLDTGAVYLQEIIPLKGTETTTSLEQTMAHCAAKSIGDVLIKIYEGQLSSTPQPQEGSTYAKKIKKEDGLINWQVPAEITERKIRAYLPWPKAFFKLPLSNGKNLNIQITQAEIISQTTFARTYPAGEIIQADKNGWIVACQHGAIKILRLIPEGKKEMSAAEFLRGRPLTVETNINL